MRGFTLGVADILMTEEADATRRSIIEKTQECGPEIVRTALGLEKECSENEMKKAVASVYNNPQHDTSGVKILDANANAIAIEHIKLENEGWERDTSVTEPTEPTLSVFAT